MQSTLEQFQETQSQDAFALQNSKLLKVRLDQVTIQAKLGSMVAYQGDVHFEHAGSGGLSRMVKKAVTGSGQAPKEDVQRMVRLILQLRETPETDVADAIALALCHMNRI